MKHLLLLTMLLLLCVSCSDKPKSGPSDIYYGEDVCERCKMIISEKKFAAQYKLSDGTSVKFDDIGCMLHHFHAESPQNLESIYVTDYESDGWIRAEDAYFVWSNGIITPMGYGIVSTKDKDNAQDLAANKKGIYIGNLDAAKTFILNDSVTNSKEQESNE